MIVKHETQQSGHVKAGHLSRARAYMLLQELLLLALVKVKTGANDEFVAWEEQQENVLEDCMNMHEYIFRKTTRPLILTELRTSTNASNLRRSSGVNICRRGSPNR